MNAPADAPIRAAIAGWGTALPLGVVTNAELEARVETSDAWIVERTGIRQRHAARDGETTASLAATAARKAIARAHLTPDDIDLLIVATCTPEQPIPHTGAFVGEAIGLRCGSFDLNTACSGFVYAMAIAESMLRNGLRHILIVGSETLSKIVNPEDRATLVLFGDGAGAAVISATSADTGVLAWDLGCDGSAVDILGMRGGGSRIPASVASVERGDHFIHMQGQEVFKRAVRAVCDSSTSVLQRAGITPNEIDWFVPHQANLRIIQSAAQRLGISEERTIVNIADVGNTSSASIPLALFGAVDAGTVQPGDLVLLSGFGAGMTWASVVVRWTGAST